MASLDMNFYNQMKGQDLGSLSDDYFRNLGVGWNRGRQDALDWMHVMRQQDPMEIAKKKEEEQKATLAAQKSALDVRVAADKQELGDYNARFASTVPAVQDEVYSKYRIPQQVDAVGALNTRIQQLKTGAGMGETAGGYANAGQVDKALQTGYIPAFNTAAGNLNTSLQVGQTEIGNRLLPISSEGKILTDRIARDRASYSQQDQNELDVLMQQYVTGTQLADNQIARMHQLAVNEQQYQNEIKKMERESELGGGDEDKRYLSGGQFYDTQTGTWLTAPKSGINNSGW